MSYTEPKPEPNSETSTLPGPVSAMEGPESRQLSWREYLMQNVDPNLSTSPLASFCFMTGFIDAITFSAVFVWCGFQTGNTVQLSLAIARLFSPGQTNFEFRMADRQALVSLLTFLGGASLGRLGDRIGSNTRLWLSLGTFIQALFTMAAALTVWKGGQGSVADDRGDPAWTNAKSFVGLGFASASIGLQGIMGKRVNSQFATTVVLTTVWCELMSDPKLFGRRFVNTRDHKFIAVFALFLGGFAGRAILDKVGSAGAFGVGTGIRFLIAIAWLFVPAKKSGK
ncbi:hypothetical protein DFH11DRAFT_1840503 [Phellopilus nigrolimitatus]|nr:hypothetical protein DFH11DRAFT_1840503 [Phellopilus nigrolimitatus]